AGFAASAGSNAPAGTPAPRPNRPATTSRATNLFTRALYRYRRPTSVARAGVERLGEAHVVAHVALDDALRGLREAALRLLEVHGELLVVAQLRHERVLRVAVGLAHLAVHLVDQLLQPAVHAGGQLSHLVRVGLRGRRVLYANVRSSHPSYPLWLRP